ncbi:MAG: hypothetical protein ACLQQ4_16750 [Bacteroidia bacterium]
MLKILSHKFVFVLLASLSLLLARFAGINNIFKPPSGQNAVSVMKNLADSIAPNNEIINSNKYLKLPGIIGEYYSGNHLKGNWLESNKLFISGDTAMGTIKEPGKKRLYSLE